MRVRKMFSIEIYVDHIVIPTDSRAMRSESEREREREKMGRGESYEFSCNPQIGIRLLSPFTNAQDGVLSIRNSRRMQRLVYSAVLTHTLGC